jgi:hypothetical protein
MHEILRVDHLEESRTNELPFLEIVRSGPDDFLKRVVVIIE